MSCLQGSSPLTRGKYIRGRNARRAAGLIPAHAGKILGGEPADGLRGLIPAHAGKISRPCPPAPGGWAHPRSRGENASQRAAFDGPRGSSPLTRGKLGAERTGAGSEGLIPAHAGKIFSGRIAAAPIRAHPRSRGENTGVSSASVAVGGSSPLTRGKSDRLQHREQGPGLIPAHAGKMHLRGEGREQPRAHPRSRGENTLRNGRSSSVTGSSPLTRGKSGAACPR